MQETLMMKHAVGGRIFIDSSKQTVEYVWEPSEAGWKFVVNTPMNGEIEELLRLKTELNVFVFQQVEGQPMKKIWFYVHEGPVTYDADQAQLTVYARSRIEYFPGDYLS
jgi:hypothetical protein